MSRDHLAVRTYGAALCLYPRRFRHEYGPDLVQLLRDQLRDEPAPVVVVRSVIDLAISVPTQHLEAHMHAPRRLVPVVYLAVAAAGLTVAIAGGSEPVGLAIGLVLAAGAGAIGLAAWRRTGTVREADLTDEWWKLVLAGPVLIAGVIAGAGVGVEAWFVGLAVVAAAVVLTALGVALGIAHAFKGHTTGNPV